MTREPSSPHWLSTRKSRTCPLDPGKVRREVQQRAGRRAECISEGAQDVQSQRRRLAGVGRAGG